MGYKKGEFISAEISKLSVRVRRVALCLLPTIPASHLPPPFTGAHSSNDLEMFTSSQVQSSQRAVKASPAQQQSSAPTSPGAKTKKRNSTCIKDVMEKSEPPSSVQEAMQKVL